MCQRALKEKAEFNVPATIINNQDPTAVRLQGIAERNGRNLLRMHVWQAMQNTYTFSTSNGTADYALPSDFQRFLNLTEWDRTNFRPLRGPSTPSEWEVLRSGQLSVASQIFAFFRISAGLFSIYPTPTSTRTIAYQYIGKNWIYPTGSGGSPSAEYFANDTDTTILDDDLMVMGIRERLDALLLGNPFVPSPEYAELIGATIAADAGKGVISFGNPKIIASVLGPGNVPDFGFNNYVNS
jgi:hypothetical protein